MKTITTRTGAPSIVRPALLPCLAIGCLLVAGCGEIASAVRKSPSEIVKEFYLAANAGSYSVAESMLTQEAKDFADGPLGQFAGGFRGVCDKNTKNGTISGIDVVSETVRGEGATVIVTIHFKDGSSKENVRDELLLRGGVWRLTIGN